ncbi:MAG: sodium:proton antiporter [Planctomycetes bacterium]|jgi:Na+/H+ antiporter NhaD/arsenite permease-like protein|nr:sodium:proton antiporter [Planctomycetota bacterium]MBT4029697.1 sodium:proton antiporter [Planctomycetota bacterium]MBT4561197.1 sodium:proton antiporter [Planctomycetota bacterium]MBT5100657.1 sodium:proton antiporter [Planctomycetota bacterium]MBT5120528.1 sodium:proton antiporter [Planctomycetota bacterium]
MTWHALLSTLPSAALTASGGDNAKFVPSMIWVLPFILMLGSIAVLPLVAEHWWHSNKNRFLVALACGLPVLGLFAAHGDWHTIGHTVHEYASFLILLGVLYTASGGIVLRGDLQATPAVNTTFLAIGSLLASFMGTTGAAMLLVRPLLRTNSERQFTVHTVVFFIFTVCNVGGCLTPLGDPPLFLGYLRGVPFAWTFNLLPAWAFTLGLLLVIYYLVDTYYWKKEDMQHKLHERVEVQPLRIAGSFNFVWLGAVILTVALLTPSNVSGWLTVGEHDFFPTYGRDLALVLLALIAYVTTSNDYRKANEFSWEPIIEVAALFFGIFLSMMAAIRLLEVNGPELGLETPTQFFWITGILSSFLDNAPTYVVFFETAKTLAADGSASIAGVRETFLVAISLGAVFMGAMTYIGNAPNFMVKAIAEQRKVQMPSFFGYMLWSVVFLLPVFFLATLIFL